MKIKRNEVTASSKIKNLELLKSKFQFVKRPLNLFYVKMADFLPKTKLIKEKIVSACFYSNVNRKDLKNVVLPIMR